MNVTTCPKCGRDLIAEEITSHICEQPPIKSVTTLYYSSFIPLKVEGKDVAILVSEDGKTLYNIKPSPTAGQGLKSPKDGTMPNPDDQSL